ncbi:MAG: tetraacyldisaccharide 4'-kinase [Bacteroidales bacterium]|nr:tetraacyldisaccharide 4'-kinase [Bacteroidales bacterium]
MRILLLPIAFFYYIILKIRHKLYDWHILKTKKHDMPVICVGNLALGGTGKTPHVEYLANLLSGTYRVCIVSRGYGRKTKGFQLANGSCNAETVGDEPMQYVSKLSNVMVAVDENRNRAIELMDTMDRPSEVYLLDDAFQHRSTQAGLNILLTAYDKLYCNDFLFPSGTLRDVKSAARRADIIVISKAPEQLDELEKAEIIGQLSPLPQQKVFFSSIVYEPLKAINEAAMTLDPEEAESVLLFCGIARPQGLMEELKRHYQQVEVLKFADHHPYNDTDVKHILEKVEQLKGEKKIVVTTEKDLARFINSPYLCQFDAVPLFVAPISVKIDQEEKFNEEILNYVRKNAHYS